MNAPIEALMEQAGIYENRYTAEKFAQLIVQKCADIGQQYADGNYEVYNQILEHFGVEEE